MGCSTGALGPRPEQSPEARREQPVSPPAAADREPPAQEGLASWYGGRFQGRRTASGDSFDQNQLTCAHPTLAFGTQVRVTNLSNGRSIVAVVNDRGPYAGGRILDLSYRAARELGFVQSGVTRVRIEVLPR